MALTESINALGVGVIVFLQSQLPSWGEFFMQVSYIGDPSLAFTVYLPLVAAVNLHLGISLLWTLILCEWCNMVLKWIMAGDRPYWWIHESPYYLDKQLPYMRQYPMTCETGPGMPSGHSTLNAAMFFLIIQGLASAMSNSNLGQRVGKNTQMWAIRLIWMTYGFWVVLVMTSRIFIAAHFPHQCILGVIIGITTAALVRSRRIFHTMSRMKSFLITLLIFVSVGSVFGTYTAFGNDPMWSINKAVRWCIEKSYIHIDSIPFYALSRYSGQALGLGLALSSTYYANTRIKRFTWKMQLSLAILGVCTGQTSVFLHKSLSPATTGYYLIEFLQNACLSYAIIGFLPYFVMTSSGMKPRMKVDKH